MNSRSDRSAQRQKREHWTWVPRVDAIQSIGKRWQHHHNIRWQRGHNSLGKSDFDGAASGAVDVDDDSAFVQHNTACDSAGSVTSAWGGQVEDLFAVEGLLD